MIVEAVDLDGLADAPDGIGAAHLELGVPEEEGPQRVVEAGVSHLDGDQGVYLELPRLQLVVGHVVEDFRMDLLILLNELPNVRDVSGVRVEVLLHLGVGVVLRLRSSCTLHHPLGKLDHD